MGGYGQSERWIDFGRQASYEGTPNAERHVTTSSSHSTIFDGTAEHNCVVIDFFQRHGAT